MGKPRLAIFAWIRVIDPEATFNQIGALLTESEAPF